MNRMNFDSDWDYYDQYKKCDCDEENCTCVEDNFSEPDEEPEGWRD